MSKLFLAAVLSVLICDAELNVLPRIPPGGDHAQSKLQSCPASLCCLDILCFEHSRSADGADRRPALTVGLGLIGSVASEARGASGRRMDPAWECYHWFGHRPDGVASAPRGGPNRDGEGENTLTSSFQHSSPRGLKTKPVGSLETYCRGHCSLSPFPPGWPNSRPRSSSRGARHEGKLVWHRLATASLSGSPRCEHFAKMLMSDPPSSMREPRENVDFGVSPCRSEEDQWASKYR